MNSHLSETEIVEGLYSVAMEPGRFRELADIWNRYLSQSDGANAMDFAQAFQKFEGHLSRAEAIFEMVENTNDAADLKLAEKINQDPQVIIAVNKFGDVEALNPAARKFFELAEGMPFAQAKLSADALSIISAEITAYFSKFQSQPNDRSHLKKIFEEGRASPLLVSFSGWVDASGKDLVLVKTSDFVWPDYLSPMIMEAFDFTEAEADIMKLMVEGKSIQDVAATRDSKLSTVRAQIRAIYSKTATRNQSEFIRMAIGLTTMHMKKQSESKIEGRATQKASMAYPHPSHEHLMTLPDGRQLDYAVFGHSQGTPCLYFHSSLLGNIWPAELTHYAIENKLKLIVPARPYYGRSTPYPAGTDHAAQTTEDLSILLDHLNISRIMLIPHTVGLLYALAFAQAHPERVTGIISICPMLPHLEMSHSLGMPKLHRMIYNIRMQQPLLLSFISRAGFAYYRAAGPYKFLHHMLSDLECDKKVVYNPANKDAILRTLEFGSVHGHKGYMTSFCNIKIDEIDILKHLKFPMFIVIGDQEKNTRKSRAQALQNNGIDIKIATAKGGGEFLMYSHPRLIIDTVMQALNYSK